MYVYIRRVTFNSFAFGTQSDVKIDLDFTLPPDKSIEDRLL
jgi:hypothetical protein